MIKLKIAELVDMKKPIEDIIEAKAKMPVKTSYWLLKFINKVGAELKHFDEQRNALVMKYGEEVEGGGYQVKPDSAQFADFAKDMNELLSIDIEISMDPIAFDSFPDTLNIPIADLFLIRKIFKDLDLGMPEEPAEETEVVEA